MKNSQKIDRFWFVIRTLLTELQPQRRDTYDLPLTIESRLDRDLGLDSLGRVELLSRLEQEFDVHLSEDLAAESETIQELLTGVLSATQNDEGSTRPPRKTLISPVDVATPNEASTLLDALDWHADLHPNRPHVFLWDEHDENAEISYGTLAKKSSVIAASLLGRGIAHGDRIALMLPTGKDFLFAFFGILRAGCVPVPIYPPVSLSRLEDHLTRQVDILRNASVAALVTLSTTHGIAKMLSAHVHTLQFVATVTGLTGNQKPNDLRHAKEEDLALLQYTSGSTGQPKGVRLTHANLLANIRETGRRTDITSADVAVSWLPMYHDMGLIGTWLGALYFGVPSVLMSPLTFLTHPEQWLRAIHKYSATISASPNFGFELCVRKIKAEQVERLRLDSVRLMFNGAEPVSPQTIRRFTEKFSSIGFRSAAMVPVYGMAENCLALTIPAKSRKPLIESIHRDSLAVYGIARLQENNNNDVMEVVSCGQPLRGHEVRVIDSNGNELPDRHEGHIQFRGPSSTSGYFCNEKATKDLLDGSWCNSGDLGYIATGEIFLTGRSKDLIIKAGRNIYPHQVEEVASQIDMVRRGCVAVFADLDQQSGTERLILVAETRETHSDQLTALGAKITAAVVRELDIVVDEVLCVRPRSLPKTSSGKIRRATARSMYQRGALGQSYSGWWQICSFAARGFLHWARRLLRRSIQVSYGIYAGLILFCGAAIATLSVWAIPGSTPRWRVIQAICRISLRLIGISVHPHGMEHLVQHNCIMVSNHASYLDALLLVAILPNRVRFVAKKELQRYWVIGATLERIGVFFIERMNVSESIKDSAVMTLAVERGERLFFFPEGTFSREAGLRDFRLGAFTAAVSAGIPVIPIALCGTRALLRDGSFLLRHGAVEVKMGNPISPPRGADFDAAIELLKASRRWILQNCGESDLLE